MAAFATAPQRSNGALGTVIVSIGGGFLMLLGAVLMGVGVVRRDQAQLDYSHNVGQLIEIGGRIEELDRRPQPGI